MDFSDCSMSATEFTSKVAALVAAGAVVVTVGVGEVVPPGGGRTASLLALQAE